MAGKSRTSVPMVAPEPEPIINSLKIVGKTYKVVYKDDADDCGLCDSQKQVITLKKGMPRDLELDTLIHEIAHAIDYQVNTEMTERQVHNMGTGFAAVFIDNPKLVEYFSYLSK